MEALGGYLRENGEAWQDAKALAFQKNGWFVESFIDKAVEEIIHNYLDRGKLSAWAAHYHIDDNIKPVTVGIVMAGNIPLVGFHDFLCCFIAGHKQAIKLSSKDDVLLKHMITHLATLNPEIYEVVEFRDMLKGCDAYIATGSNNTSRYFEQYFGKYPNLIRRNRTSVAVLDGSETEAELDKLVDDIHLYFGLGCRNVTKLLLPLGYDFIPLINASKRYDWFQDHHKFKNNYDYQLSILLLNGMYYMTGGSVLYLENDALFSPISQVNYAYYEPATDPYEAISNNEDVQVAVGHQGLAFGEAQHPTLFQYADGVDTMQFLLSL